METSRPTQHTRVALVIESHHTYNRGVILGVRDYVSRHVGWELRTILPDPPDIDALIQWNPHGVIASPTPTNLSTLFPGVPLVNLFHPSPTGGSPGQGRVGIDEKAVGRLAAEYLSGLGFRHFGYSGFPGVSWSYEREQAFQTALGRLCPKHQYFCLRHPSETSTVQSRQAALRRWVPTLPRSIAVFAGNDDSGLDLTQVCRRLKRRVPEEVAILGVDDDDLMCAMAEPPLSSITIPWRRIGIEAAALLHQIMATGKPLGQTRLLEPTGVLPRLSTGVPQLDDPDLMAAIQFIRSQAGRVLPVTEVAGQVPLSRRTLERRFQEVLGRSILEEIRREHVERAKRLLGASSLKLATVAQQSGFANAARFSRVFRKQTGLTPTEYRRWMRADGS